MITRKDAIEKTLGSIYSSNGKTKGTMIEDLADYLDRRIDSHRTESEDHDHFLHLVTNEIWMWFSGGGTARIAAQAVVKAIDEQEE